MFGNKKILAEINKLKTEINQAPSRMDLLEMFKEVGRVGPVTHYYYEHNQSGVEQIRTISEYIDFSTIDIPLASGGRF